MQMTIEQVINALKCKRDRIVGCSLKCPYHVIKRLGDGDAESPTFVVNGSPYFDQCDIIGLCRDAADLLESMAAKSEKYRWHDLRKNPDDLPNGNDYYGGNDYYECVHEEYEEDSRYPKYQFDDVTNSFGYWENIFDPVSLGFVDSEFRTVADMGYTPIVAWREIALFECELR